MALEMLSCDKCGAQTEIDVPGELKPDRKAMKLGAKQAQRSSYCDVCGAVLVREVLDGQTWRRVACLRSEVKAVEVK